MKIDKNCIVSICYKLSNEQGEPLDQSPEDEPLVYMHGGLGVLPALEVALEGKEVGDSFDVTITPSEGFGEQQPSLIQVVPRSAVSGDQELAVGMQISAQTDQGEQIMSVTAFDDSTITIDGNHPLAGMTLRFEGNIEDVHAASEDEVKHWPNPVPDADESTS